MKRFFYPLAIAIVLTAIQSSCSQGKSLPAGMPSNAASSPEDEPPVIPNQLRRVDTTVPMITYTGLSNE